MNERKPTTSEALEQAVARYRDASDEVKRSSERRAEAKVEVKNYIEAMRRHLNELEEEVDLERFAASEPVKSSL